MCVDLGTGVAIWALVLAAGLPASSGAAHLAAAAEEPPPAEPTSDERTATDAAPAESEHSDALMSEEALARFQQLLQRKPLHNPAFQGLVRHYAEQGKLKDLVREYEQKVRALPDQVALQIVLARVYLRAGQAEQAAGLVDKLEALPQRLARDESRLLVFKSEIYQRIGRIDAARTMLARALEQARTISERLKLSEALADLHLRADEREQAAAALTRLADEYPDNYLHRKRVADALAQRGLHEPAVGQYRAALDLVKDQTDKRCETLRQLGRSLERLERRQDAIAVYTEAINLLSSGHWLQRELHERIVSLYRAADRLDDLVEYCREQVERRPEQTAMRGLLADVLAARGDVEAAKETLAEAVQLFPKDRTLSEKRVHFLGRVDDPEGVAAEYERIIAQHPDDLELYVGYGQFLADNQELEAARRQWKHVLGSELTDVALANRLGGLFEPYELHDDAVECYERAITLDPTRPESYTALGRLWFFRGEREKALATLERMAQANPEDAGIHASLCQSLLALGQTDRALEAITHACELDPGQVRHQLSRADLLVRAGQLEEALQVRRSAIELMQNPVQQAQAINILVSIHASADKLADLRSAEEDRLKAHSNDAVSLMLLARAADFERDFPTARGWLERLLETDPAHQEGRRQLARLHEAVGDVDTAVEQYRRLIDLHPARGRQFYQAIADAKLRYQDKAGAIETFERMVQADPDNATVLKEVAEQVARLGELEKAIGHYEQSLRIQPDRHEVRLAYAEALQEAGRLPEALAAFKATALQKKDRDSAADALAKLHDAADHLGALDELLEELEARVESDPDDTLVARTLAHLLIREYEYTRAKDLLDLVLRHHPRDAELHLVKAELLRRLTRFDDALETYRLVLRSPRIDRDFVLGEMGKAYFESGRIEQARRVWRQVNHKLYAGTLLRNNGLLVDAIEVLQEGIRLKPDDYGLHRNLIRTLDAAGKTDEMLAATRRLLDLEPDNVLNVTRLAKAYLDHGDRAAAAEIAGRLFSAGVGEKKNSRAASHLGGSRGMPLWALSMQSAWWGSGQGPTRNNLDRGVRFFQENGLRAELEEVLTEQLAAQPENAILRVTAVQLFSDQFAKPEVALRLLKELESGSFPLEHQSWLGQSSQADHFRVRQYQLIASKPALRDRRLAELGPKPEEELDRDETIELAVIRQAQGVTDEAIGLLERAVATAPDDIVALSALVDTLVRAERFSDAEPHAKRLGDRLAAQRERMQAEMIERVRRDFVRTLPLRFQLRVTDQLLRDIAHKWTLGQSFATDFTGFVQTMGYFRARLTLATICAKTERMELAREIWQELRPTNPADSDGWTMLAGVAQLHDQQDVAFEYYQQALRAAKVLATDPLLQRIYSGSLSQVWFGGQETIDSSFNRIVEAFSGRDKLIELYDFLRETDQLAKAKRVAEQYELYDELKALFVERFEQAGEAFRRSADEPFYGSVPYLMHACKLAELHDLTGDWPAAQAVYERYLADFPDELGLLVTLSETAEQQGEFAEAIRWERRVIEAKERLARRARDWALREIFMTPAIPQVLEGAGLNRWSWPRRWGKHTWSGYGPSSGGQFERSTSWMRIGQLCLAMDNSIAAADAMERAIGAAGTARDKIAKQILALIRQRQLTASMLSVLRSLAVYLPADEQVQLSFAESLEASGRGEVAKEVYRRILRRGVSDLGVLAQIRRQMGEPDGSGPGEAPATLVSLAAEVAADPDNAHKRLRLAKAYYYSLEVDQALETLRALEETAPHLEGLHDLLIEIYTIQGDSEKLIEALRTKIKRSGEEKQRRKARESLAEELLSTGRTDEALEVLKELVDPKNPTTYQRVGTLLQYFGRHDEAIEQFEVLGRSQRRGMWNQDTSGITLAKALAVKGDLEAAADKILESVDSQARQASQYGGMAGLWSFFERENNYFDALAGLFVLVPQLRDEVRDRLAQRHEANPTDPQAAKLLMQFHRRVGRNDLAEAIMEGLAGEGVTDQTLVTQLIDLAIKRKEHDKAITMAERFIAQQPKPKLPPGIPSQFAGMMNLMSPRNVMLCKLGDVHWKMGNPDKAFEAYQQIVDENLDETRIAYATICVMRDRVDEARELLEEALAAQKVKTPNLLQFRALLAAVDDEPEVMFDCLAQSIEAGGAEAMNPFSFGEQGVGPELLADLARQTDQVDRLRDFLQERIKKNPNKWEHHRVLATTLYQGGRIEEAFEALDRAAGVKSLKRETLQQRIAWLEGHTPAAELVPLYRELIRLSEQKVKKSSSLLGRFFGGGGQPEQRPIDTQPLRNRLGDLLWELENHEQAATVWTERMDLKAASSHVSMGQRYNDKREYDRAERCYQRALELQPDNVTAHRALAELDFHRQRKGAALEHMQEVFRKRYQPKAPPRPDRWRYQGRWDQSSGPNDELRPWALELAVDAENAAQAGEAGDVPEQRLMLARLTGDWSAVEATVRERLTRSPYDPMVWTLWAEVHERKGDWAEAVRSRQYVRRLKRTTLPQHRKQSELVLAGKQIKDAAAGIKEAEDAAAAAQTPGTAYPGYYPGYGSYWSRSADSDTAHLAALYVKLGQFEQAERLYLLMGERNIAQSVLPELAGLMWRQGAEERAVELLRLAVVMSENTRLIPRFAGMLTEAGRVDDAVSLLIRAYRCLKARETGGPFAMMWGGYGGGDEELEDNQEKRLASALHDILSRKGALETTLAELKRQVAREPDDARLAKLILSLQIRGRRWTEAREALTARRVARPHDVAVIMEQLRVNLQLRDWAAALQVLEELRQESPESSDRLRIHEAFARIMRGDCEGAVTAVEPLVDRPAAGSPDARPAQIWTVLAVARDYARLRGYLEGLLERDALDETGRNLLIRTHLIEGDGQSAVRLAIDRLWDERTALTEASAAYRALVTAVRHSRGVSQTAAPGGDRPEDGALITLVTDGPAAGARAFRELRDDDPDNLNAYRGLVLSAALGEDHALAASANQELIDWLASRRLQVWRPAARQSVGERAEQFLTGVKSAGLDSSSILGMTMSFANLLQRALRPPRAQANAAVKYDTLWRAHHLLQPNLLVLADRTDELASLLETQAGYAAAAERLRSGRSNRRYYSSPFGYIDYGNYDRRNDRDETFARDWRAALRKALREGQRYGVLADNLEGLGSRVPRDYWPALGEACAAAGRDEDAQRWRRKAMNAKLADLRAGEGPQVVEEKEYQRWRWRSYGQTAAQQVLELRSKLQVQPTRARQTTDDGPQSPLTGKVNDLWEFALVEPEAGRGLEERARMVGPGWGDTQAVQQLVAYHQAKKQPEKVIALLDRIWDSDELLGSEHLSTYVRACYDAQNWGQLEKVLAAALELSSTLANDVGLARLAMLRHRGRDAEADALEKRLVDGCRAEAENPHRLDQRLLGHPAEGQRPPPMRQSRWSPWQRRQIDNPPMRGGFTDDLGDVTSLARALGLQYEGAVTPEGLDLSRVRTTYAIHGLYRHAARIADIELARLPAGATERERIALLNQKATYLAKADDDSAARELAEQVRSFWEKQAQIRPADARPHERLAVVYASKAFGHDYERAYEALLTAKRLDPAIDRGGRGEARYLYKLGRYAEAWEAYRSALNRSETGADPGTMYRAGIAARKSGHADVAAGLIRRALWCDPQHTLADEARELINE